MKNRGATIRAQCIGTEEGVLADDVDFVVVASQLRQTLSAWYARAALRMRAFLCTLVSCCCLRPQKDDYTLDMEVRDRVRLWCFHGMLQQAGC